MIHLAAVLSASLLAAPPPPAMAKDPSITAVADAYVAATLKGDAAAIMALYTDDPTEMPPNVAPVKGRQALEAYYKKQFEQGKPTAFALEHLESRSSGDIGYDIGTYRQSMTMNGNSMNDTGKYIVVLHKTGGKWKVAYAIYNSDNPPPPMAGAQEHHH